MVSSKRGTDGQMWSVPVSWDSGNWVTRLLVLKTLSNCKCFLFPDNHMGPDLSCFVQDVITKGSFTKQAVEKTQCKGLWVPWHLSTPNFFTTSKCVLNVCLCMLILQFCIEERRSSGLCPVKASRSSRRRHGRPDTECRIGRIQAFD